MYCPSCGAPLTAGLSYCNRCGASLKPPEPTAPAGRPAGLGWIIWFAVLIMGTPFPAMIIIFDEVKKLKAAGFTTESVMALAVISLLAVLGGVALLGRMLSPMVKVYLQSGAPAAPKQQELGGRSTAQIEAPREPLMSVTENTTRAFDPVHREQKARPQ